MVVAATHCDLEQLAEQQQFRSDLWFRLSAIELQVPRQRERVEEIAQLVDSLYVARAVARACRADALRSAGI
jgi:transcriptional regulator of acetoin/glycerol metabolism